MSANSTFFWVYMKSTLWLKIKLILVIFSPSLSHRPWWKLETSKGLFWALASGSAPSKSRLCWISCWGSPPRSCLWGEMRCVLMCLHGCMCVLVRACIHVNSPVRAMQNASGSCVPYYIFFCFVFTSSCVFVCPKAKGLSWPPKAENWPTISFLRELLLWLVSENWNSYNVETMMRD